MRDNATDTLKADLIQAMEAYFGTDARRIHHAKKVTGFVEQLLDTETDYAVCVAAAVLHDIGIHEAERKYGSTAGKYQEMEGPGIARPILERLGFPEAKITEVCDIIAHHHSPGIITTRNFGALSDADWLVNLRDDYDIRDTAKLEHIINRVLQTPQGKALARKIYLSGEG